MNEGKPSGTVRLQGAGVKKVEVLKYSGSTVQSNGECGKEVKKQHLLELKLFKFLCVLAN